MATNSQALEDLRLGLAGRFGDVRALKVTELLDGVQDGDPAAVEALNLLERALSGAGDVGEAELDLDLWGPEPPAVADDPLVLAAGAAQESALAEVLSGSLSRQQAAGLLGITPQGVSRRLHAGRLVALRRGREKRLPGWQFSDGAALPGLEQLIAAYPGTPLSLSVWALSPASDLSGRTPAELLGRPDGLNAVLELARALGSEAW